MVSLCPQREHCGSIWIFRRRRFTWVGRMSEQALHRKFRTFGGVCSDHNFFQKLLSWWARECSPKDGLCRRRTSWHAAYFPSNRVYPVGGSLLKTQVKARNHRSRKKMVESSRKFEKQRERKFWVRKENLIALMYQLQKLPNLHNKLVFIQAVTNQKGEQKHGKNSNQLLTKFLKMLHEIKLSQLSLPL